MITSGWVLAFVGLTGCVTQVPPPATPAKVAGAPAAPATPDPAIDSQHPRARPQIVKQQQIRPAIFTRDESGAPNPGSVVVDSKWSNYGSYLQRMIDQVQLEWDRLLIERKKYPDSGTYVSVKFVVDAEGRVARIIEVENHSSEDGAKDCVTAITRRAPYGAWTDDMKAVLGEKQEMTFKFYYQ
jgi:hypothetical protein